MAGPPPITLGARRMPSKWRKALVRAARARVPLHVPVALLLLLAVQQLYGRRRSAAGANAHMTLLSGGIAACQGAEPAELSSYDAYAQQFKLKGVPQERFETRFQETVWDTLPLATKSHFPADSDKPWRIDEYGRGLKRDIIAFIAVAKGAGANGVAYIHTRVDRVRGLQMVGAISNNHINSLLSIRRTFDSADGSCEVALRERIDEPRVHLVVPYASRATRLRMLLENVRALRDGGADLVVVVCILESEKNDLNVATEIAREVFGERKLWQRVVSLSTNAGDADGKFSRGVALREAVRHHIDGDNDVAFLCDVDMAITNGFIERCSHNAIPGNQVYYPVFYSLYPYANAAPSIKQFNGMWRDSSYGMACFRKSDFMAVDAFRDAETRFRGWGSEDVYLWESVRNHSKLVAFRAVEPGLIHRWHSKECDKDSHDYWNCMKTNFMTMGHPLRIGPQLLQKVGGAKYLYELSANS